MSLRRLELRQRIGKLRTTDGSVNFPRSHCLSPLACTGGRLYDEASGWIVAIACGWAVIHVSEHGAERRCSGTRNAARCMIRFRSRFARRSSTSITIPAAKPADTRHFQAFMPRRFQAQWPCRHGDDTMRAAVRSGQAIALGSRVRPTSGWSGL